MPPIACDGKCKCDESGYCMKTCQANSQCSCGEKCSVGRCKTQCTSNNKCPKGHICSRGFCSPGCLTNNDCSGDRSCKNSKCVDPCDKSASPCGRNALCRVSQHKAICLCPDGYSGEASKSCTPYECNSDNDCSPEKHCSPAKTCKNPCLEQGVCGANAQCKIVDRHAQCLCVPGYVGNPLVECKQETGGACLRNPCGENARCRDMSDGAFECSCPPNCIGDAMKNCICESRLINLCKEKHCGVNAACRILNQKAECYCPDNFPSGDPFIECKLFP